jgi:hypothetical protein
MNWQYLFSQYISPIGGIGMFIATIILLYLTAKYLGFTKHMAVMMQKEFEIRLKPVVEIDIAGISIQWGDFHMGFTIEVFNRGSYAVYLSGYEIRYWNEDSPDRISALPQGEVNRMISPTEGRIQIRGGVCLSDLKDFDNLKTKYTMIEFNLSFLDIRGKKFSEKAKRKIYK